MNLLQVKTGTHMHSKRSWNGALYDPCTVKINLRNYVVEGLC